MRIYVVSCFNPGDAIVGDYIGRNTVIAGVAINDLTAAKAIAYDHAKQTGANHLAIDWLSSQDSSTLRWKSSDSTTYFIERFEAVHNHD